MLNTIRVKILSNLTRLFLYNMNKEAKGKKTPLHFPACSGAGHACDVTISIYTATGKSFFLHCYIVTDGAGAKRGEARRKASSRPNISNISNILTPFGNKKKQPKPALKREDS